MVMSRDQNAVQNHYIKLVNKSFERAKQFRYLETTLTHKNFVHEVIKRRLNSENASYDSVQNLFSSSLLPKHIKIKVYITVIFPVFWVGVKLGPSH
jgi:hypothetical protein